MDQIQEGIEDLRDLVRCSFDLLADSCYRDGMMSIEAAFDTFMDVTNPGFEEKIIEFRKVTHVVSDGVHAPLRPLHLFYVVDEDHALHWLNFFGHLFNKLDPIVFITLIQGPPQNL